MTLPKLPPPRATVEIAGELVEIRGLTRAEAARCQKMVDTDTAWDALEVAVIGYGTDTATEEVREWYEKVDAGAAAELFDAIKGLSRLDDEGASKSGTGDRPRPG